QSVRCLAVTLVFVLSIAPASAQSLDQLDTALKRVPADTAFFSTMLRNKEQIELALQSKAWQKLWNLPVVQMGWNRCQREMKKDPALSAFLDDKENQELLALATDGVSHEVFVSGGAAWADIIKFLQDMNGSMYTNSKLGGVGAGGRPDPRAQAEAM